MKYLKKYNESILIDNFKEISNTIDDICLELEDMKFSILNNLKNGFIEINKKGGSLLFRVSDTKSIIDEFIDIIIRIKDYIESKGLFIYEVEYFKIGTMGSLDLKTFISYMRYISFSYNLRQIVIKIKKG